MLDFNEAVKPHPFYLSDEKDKTFDKFKVGKVKNGKYLIVYNFGIIKIDKSEVAVFSIDKLDDENLTMTLYPDTKHAYEVKYKALKNKYKSIKQSKLESFDFKILK